MREASDVGVRATATRELDRMRRAGLDFHLGIIALARSPSLDTFAAKLFTQLHLAYHQTTDPAEFHASYFKRNAQICTLLEEGRNTEASNEMRRYLQDAQAHLLSAISTRD
ncbi:FCD domain-containing protein [Saccharopolyspora hattusasensis]|uniref:FCD domain-containing protein n=1 Tax=Saccharopolyspora hattusasensis TaxID=1128679 RepID=UPI003D979A14